MKYDVGKRREKVAGRMKKISLVLLVVLMICLSACGKQVKEKSEEEIKADMAASESFWHVQEVEIDEFVITKRQINEETKEDKVYVDVKASNDNVEVSGSYYLKYGLYESGWILDAMVEESDIIVKPKTEPTNDFIANHCPEGYQLKQVDKESDTIYKAVYEMAEESLFRSIYYEKQISFYFEDKTAEWTKGTEEDNTEIVWNEENIEGRWQAVMTPRTANGATGVESLYQMEIYNVTQEGFDIKVYRNDEMLWEDDEEFVHPDHDDKAYFDVFYWTSNASLIVNITKDGFIASGTVEGVPFEKVE